MHERTDHPSDLLSDAIDDISATESALVSFIQDRVQSAGADGVVVAMSGGLDSTVAATLAVEALGPERVLGLGLPCHKTDATAALEASTVADALGMPFERVQLRPLLLQFDQTVAPALDPADSKRSTPTAGRARENAIARLRMLCAYYAATRTNRLVLGTVNRSELLLGYVTKHGDGAADLFPLGDLYKTEVRALAEHLGVPDHIVGKEPTAGFRPGQTDADDLGASYDVIDSLLYRIIEQGVSVEAAADAVGVDSSTARQFVEMCSQTAHKRARPPVPGVEGRVRRPTVPDSGE
ncbi:NAD+ synthase [Haloarcula halophila]|uniref:NAD+ synthase n=1 Tax=Haloarcula TaxID=2237 RepID=UPI0023E39F21|nr:NAD+ synthase [Halomicroarcula sp. DFY41]